MCGSLPEDADLILGHDLTPAIWTGEQIAWISAAVESSRRRQPLAVHLEIDTGMARQGVECGASLDVCCGISQMRAVTCSLRG